MRGGILRATETNPRAEPVVSEKSPPERSGGLFYNALKIVDCKFEILNYLIHSALPVSQLFMNTIPETSIDRKLASLLGRGREVS